MQRNTRKKSWLGALIILVACSSSTEPGGNGAAVNDPNAPSNLVAGPLGGGVHLTWTDNSTNEETFEIERREGSAAFATIDSVPFNADLYHDSNVTIGNTYSYRVRATFATGVSAYSNEASTTAVIADSVATGGGGGGSTSLTPGGSTAGGAGGASTSGSGGSNQTGGSSAGGQMNAAGMAGQVSSAGASGASGSAGSGGSAGAGGSQAVVSFQNDVVPSLVASCGSTNSGCHNIDQAVGRIMPQFGPCKVIWFSAADAPAGATYTSGPNQGQPTGCPDLTLYERLMDLHSMLCEAPSWDQRKKYVVPGDIDNSLLYQVIAGDPSMGGVCTNMGVGVGGMPKVDPLVEPNPVLLTADQIAKIRDWIMQGAPNN